VRSDMVDELVSFGSAIIPELLDIDSYSSSDLNLSEDCHRYLGEMQVQMKVL